MGVSLDTAASARSLAARNSATAGSNWSGDTVGGLQAFYGSDQVIGSNFCQTSWWGGGYYWYCGQHTYV
jgi:hypothetical protein